MRTPSERASPSWTGSAARTAVSPIGSGLESAQELAHLAQGGARRHLLLADAEEDDRLGAEKDVASQRRRLGQEPIPAAQVAPHLGGDLGIGPAGGDHLLQHADVAGRQVVLEVVTG